MHGLSMPDTAAAEAAAEAEAHRLEEEEEVLDAVLRGDKHDGGAARREDLLYDVEQGRRFVRLPQREEGEVEGRGELGVGVEAHDVRRAQPGGRKVGQRGWQRG